MRKIGVVGIFVGTIMVAAITLSFTASIARAADPKAEITALEKHCATLSNVDELMGCYDATDELVVYDVIPPREYDGPKAVRADFANFFASFKDPKIEFVDLHVVADAKLGFARSIQHFTGIGKDGKPADMTFRVTDCLHKVHGKWKILHQHISFPVDLATGKADTQSKP